jgi:putative SOS response-associated peptidase YedK
MCISLGKQQKTIPGTYQVIRTPKGTQLNLYGFSNGYQYNVRSDSMNTVWKKLRDNRGIFLIDSFWEKGKEFTRSDNKLWNVAVLFNLQDEFAIITTQANPVVKPFHQRMPLCLTDEGVDQFLRGEDMWDKVPPDLYHLNNPVIETV